MTEENNFGDLDIQLDEATQARVQHAEFLEMVKEWGSQLGLMLMPFTSMANAIVVNKGGDEDLRKKICEALPVGVEIVTEHINEMYDLIQTEAVKVLGAAFAIHDNHSDVCDGTLDMCPHQDHYLPKKDGE